MNDAGVQQRIEPHAGFAPDAPAVRSWIACVVAMVTSGCLSALMPMYAGRYRAISSDFRLKLPARTELMLQIPSVAFWIAGALTLGGLLTVQVLLPSKRTAIVLHLLAISVWSLFGVMHNYALSEVFWTLTTGMAAGGTGGGP